MKIIEFFAGSRSISTRAEELGIETFCVDFEPFEGIDLVADIEFLTVDDFPFIPDAAWFSPPCQTYSVAAFQYHRYGIEPKSNFAKKSDRVLANVVKLIKGFLERNPKFVFWIENPVGMMRKMPVMQQFKRATVNYCRYGDMRMKPTDIWSNGIYSHFNKTGWKPRPLCKKSNPDCHHDKSPRGSHDKGTNGLKNHYERSKVPPELCREILQSLIDMHEKKDDPGSAPVSPIIQPKRRPFSTYNGGKNGSGVYQAIINQIPPHETFISMFAGNCGVLANKRPAEKNIVIDLDNKVIEGWQKIPGVIALKADAIDATKHLAMAGTGVFLFADPPYLKTTRTHQGNLYRYNMTEPGEHEAFLSAILKYKCPVMVTHYPCELYDKMLKIWRKVDIEGRSRNGMRIERLYMNYPKPVALHDYSYIGADYREREEYKKMARNMDAKFSKMTELERNYCLWHLQKSGYLPAFSAQQFESIYKPFSRMRQQNFFGPTAKEISADILKNLSKS